MTALIINNSNHSRKIQFLSLKSPKIKNEISTIRTRFSKTNNIFLFNLSEITFITKMTRFLTIAYSIFFSAVETVKMSIEIQTLKRHFLWASQEFHCACPPTINLDILSHEKCRCYCNTTIMSYDIVQNHPSFKNKSMSEKSSILILFLQISNVLCAY